ncbi:cytochrome P450 [Kribbella sp. NPDC050820]|uniref:cytochrome P450 n=1 Tax=Kribbella sp. NPDC050820 TaxID=3155408 RepID=UPI0033F20569
MITDTSTYPFEITDPFRLPEQFAWLREHRPVSMVHAATGDEVWLVSDYASVRAVLSDRRFSRNIFRADAARLLPGVPVRQVSVPFVDPPAHTRWRKLVSRAFTPRRVEGMRPRIQEIVDALLDDMEKAGAPADLVQSLSYPLSNAVICELLGITAAEHEPFRSLANTALTINDSSPEEQMAAHQAMGKFSRDLIAAKRRHPGDDVLSQLIAAYDEEDGRLSEDELVATILAIFIGGYESTVNQFGKGILALFRFPSQLAALRADLDAVPMAVEEMLRFAALDSGFGSPRYATEEVQVGDVTIPKGATVLVIRQSADRDEAQFPDPERFDIRREEARAHNAFGHGPHHCLGAALARLELQIGIGTLLRRFPDLALTMAVEEIPWDYRLTVAGPRTLPVTW